MDAISERPARAVSPSANPRGETDLRGLGQLLDLLLPARRTEALQALSERGLIDAATAPRWAAELARPLYSERLVSDLLAAEKVRLDAALEARGGELTTRKTQDILQRLRRLLQTTGRAEVLAPAAINERTVLDFGAGIYSTLAASIALYAQGFGRAIAYEPYPIEVGHVACSVAQTMRTIAFDAAALGPGEPRTMRQRVAALDLDGLEARLAAWAAGDDAVLDLGGIALCRDLAALPDASVDLVFSNSVLEHVDDLTAAMRGLHRLVRPDGLCVHTVDFSDHRAIGTGLHPFQMYLDGVLAGINGLRPSQLEACLTAAGFDGSRVPALQLPSDALPPRAARIGRYATLPDEDLAVWVNSYVLRKRG